MKSPWVYIAPESGLTSGSTSVMDAISILDDAVLENRENIEILSGVVEDLVNAFDDLQEEVDNIEDGVGLGQDGKYIMKTGTTYLDSATTVEEEIAILDVVAASAMTEIEELQKRNIAPRDESIIVEVSGYTTLIGVQLDPEDQHLYIGENGIWFDGNFGQRDENGDDIPDEDSYDYTGN